jgi:hypothetical protein
VLAHKFTRSNDCKDLGALLRNFLVPRPHPECLISRGLLLRSSAAGAKKRESQRHISPKRNGMFRIIALIPVLADADSQGGFPNRAEFDSTMANKRRFAMAAAVGLRGDYDAGALRAAAKRSKDGAQTRRLLALCGDLRRREPYRGGEDWRGDASGRSRLGGKVQRAGA